MAKPDENQPAGSEPEEGGAGTPAPSDEGGNQPQGDDLKDKHGEDAVNRGRYNRDMKAKDDEIAELKRQLEQANGEASKGADALKEIAELKSQLADEKVSGALRLAGCVNEKAAKALLDDYEGDVGKLAEACPYLFGGNATRQQGSTGAKHGGAPDKDEDEQLDKAFGLK